MTSRGQWHRYLLEEALLHFRVPVCSLLVRDALQDLTEQLHCVLKWTASMPGCEQLKEEVSARSDITGPEAQNVAVSG